MRWSALALLFALAGCTQAVDDVPDDGELPAFELHSSAFIHNTAIPARFTCDGAGQVPSLFWNGYPQETTHFALVFEDTTDGKTQWGWWNLTAGQTASSGARDDLPQLTNRAGATGYVAPCPPAGETHVYAFWLYAVDGPLDLEHGASRADFDLTIASQAVGVGHLRGTYARGV